MKAFAFACIRPVPLVTRKNTLNAPPAQVQMKFRWTSSGNPGWFYKARRSTCTGNYPKGHFFRSFSPNNSYRNWPTHGTFLSHFYFTHSSGRTLVRLQLVSAVHNLLLPKIFSTNVTFLPYRTFLGQKKETTGPRVLILILVFIFILFE